MKNADLLESVRASLRLGLIQVQSDSTNSFDQGLLFFGEVPPAALKQRSAAIEEGRGAEQWFLVTDRPRGLEWKEEILERYGLWIVEVEDLARARARAELLDGR